MLPLTGRGYDFTSQPLQPGSVLRLIWPEHMLEQFFINRFGRELYADVIK